MFDILNQGVYYDQFFEPLIKFITKCVSEHRDLLIKILRNSLNDILVLGLFGMDLAFPIVVQIVMCSAAVAAVFYTNVLSIVEQCWHNTKSCSNPPKPVG